MELDLLIYLCTIFNLSKKDVADKSEDYTRNILESNIKVLQTAKNLFGESACIALDSLQINFKYLTNEDLLYFVLILKTIKTDNEGIQTAITNICNAIQKYSELKIQLRNVKD